MIYVIMIAVDIMIVVDSYYDCKIVNGFSQHELENPTLLTELVLKLLISAQCLYSFNTGSVFQQLE